MCMTNINANIDFEAVNNNEEIITIISKPDLKKAIPLQKTKKVLFTFTVSIINGTVKFFSLHHKLYFQLRITDGKNNNGHNILMKEYDLDMENENFHCNTELVDFIYQQKMFMLDFDPDMLELNKKYYLSVLVKTQKDMEEDKSWTIQSMMPLNLK